MRLPSWACLRIRLFSSTPARLKEKSSKRESPRFKPLISHTTSEITTSIGSFTTGATMASATTTAQLSENHDLIALLHDLPKKLVRSSTYPAPADPSIQVRSWKMNEFKYYDVPCPFPTLARGLFTREIPADPQGNTPKTYEIVARGYDKFFNIGEVPWTTVGFCFLFFSYSLLTVSFSGHLLKRILLLRIPFHWNRMAVSSSSPLWHPLNCSSHPNTLSVQSTEAKWATPKQVRRG